MAEQNTKQMPVSGTQVYGKPQGQPKETSKITYGNDLRSK